MISTVPPSTKFEPDTRFAMREDKYLCQYLAEQIGDENVAPFLTALMEGLRETQPTFTEVGELRTAILGLDGAPVLSVTFSLVDLVRAETQQIERATSTDIAMYRAAHLQIQRAERALSTALAIHDATPPKSPKRPERKPQLPGRIKTTPAKSKRPRQNKRGNGR